MKTKNISYFRLNIFVDDEGEGYINVAKPVKGVVELGIARSKVIRMLMVGWSSTYHCQEVIQTKTRIGKQVYLESVKALVGEVETDSTHLLENGSHVYEFEFTDHVNQVGETSKAKTRLSWHNFKAVMIDDKSNVHHADIVIRNYDNKLTEISNFDGQTTIINNEQTHLVTKATVHKEKNANEVVGKDSRSDVGMNKQNDAAKKQNKLKLFYRLKKPFYRPDDAITFVVQCENNSKKGYKYLQASIIERRLIEKTKGKDKENSDKFFERERNEDNAKRSDVSKEISREVASIVGPSVGPKEVVSWDSQLNPEINSETNECWYTLKIELKNKFMSKVVTQIPVVIMADPLTPSAVQSSEEV